MLAGMAGVVGRRAVAIIHIFTVTHCATLQQTAHTHRDGRKTYGSKLLNGRLLRKASREWGR